MARQRHSPLSVVIPTYNRRNALQETLDSLCRQTYLSDQFEVIVVDDGSDDGTDQIAEIAYPFDLVYLRQTNQGSAVARNHGAEKSVGEVLAFVDDDVTLDPAYLAAIVEKTCAGVITMGVWQPYEPSNCSHFCSAMARRVESQAVCTLRDEEVAFTECASNNLAVSRADFLRVGMWRDVLGDGPTLWGDVEFGYRAWRAGCRFVRVADARIIHRDQHVSDLAAATRRAYHVSKMVQPLFALHPEIKDHIPMLRDKDPIMWRADPASLIARKLARRIISSPPVLCGMERLVRALETHYPSSTILGRLYRWITSAYIYKGYRQGLQELEAGRSG